MEWIAEYGAYACLVCLLLTAFGLPIPEEVSVLTLGVLLASESNSLLEIWLIAIIGIIGSDLIAWYIGRKVGLTPTGVVGKLIGEEQIEDISVFYERWGDWAIFIARQFPGMRFPTFFFAGATKVTIQRFLWIDLLAAQITSNLYLFLGYSFAQQREQIQQSIERFVSSAGTASTIVIVLVFSLLFFRKYRKKKSTK